MSTEIKKKVISKEPDSNLKNCIGCHQPIHSLAKICPHCGTKQASKQWLNLDSF